MKKEPTLILVRSIHELTREELENILETLRFRRMQAATALIQGKNAKLAFQAGKYEERIRRHYDMLAKEITSVDRALDKVDKRIVEIETLKQSIGVLTDQMVTLGADDDESDI